MRTNSTPDNTEPQDAADTSVIPTNRNNYILAGILLVFTIAVVGGRYLLEDREYQRDEITVVPEDVDNPVGTDVVITMPPVPTGVEKTADPNAELIATLQAENKQIRMAMLELRRSMLDKQRETKPAEDDTADPFARYRNDHILTIDYTAAPAGSAVGANGLGTAKGITGHIPDRTSEAVKVANLKYWIRKGTQIPILPVTPINTELGGMVVGRVDEDVYSADGRCLLIPRWSNAIGNVNTTIVPGGRLIKLTWTEIQNADGTTIYTESQGGNAVGQPGVSGHKDNKFFARYGVPLLFSLLSVETDRISDSRGRDIASSMSEAASDILDDTLNIKPTVYLQHTDKVISLIVTNDWHFKGVTTCR